MPGAATVDDGLAQARAAQAAGRRSLEATERKTAEIQALGRLMRELRSQNHFAERVAEMLAPQERGNGHAPGS